MEKWTKNECFIMISIKRTLPRNVDIFRVMAKKLFFKSYLKICVMRNVDISENKIKQKIEFKCEIWKLWQSIAKSDINMTRK